MQAFEIFKTGKHTAANGVTLEFGEDMLKQAVVAYDPALHEAPIVVGHPKDNGPAYGWIKSLSFTEDGMIVANPDQVDADFAEMVEAGRFKKRSASWYLPDSPSNPKPGTLYLRHVGFLGAQPPAIKGLKDVSFGEAEEGVIEFVEGQSSPYIWSMMAGLFRGLREWMIETKGVEQADKLLPGYAIDELKSEADRKRAAEDEAFRKAMEATPQPVATPIFNEQGQEMLTPEQIAALQAENERLKAEAQKSADFAEKEKSIAEREKALAKKEIETEIDGLVAAGKVLPAQKAGLAEFMSSLTDAEQVVEFGEGEQAKKVSPRQFMRDFLSSMPKLVEFGEKSGDDKGSAQDLTAQELADKAVAYSEAMSKKGITVSATDAVAAVKAGKKAE